MTTLATISAAAAAMLMLAGAPASAQSYGDPGSGLSVAPPKTFRAEAGKPHPQFDVTIDIHAKGAAPKPVGSSALCTLGFKASPQNAGLTRQVINAQMAKPEWQKQYNDMFSAIGTVSELKLFEHQGFNGIELVVAPKDQAVRMFSSTLETAKGRTALICATDQAGFAAALPQFRALRATIHAPE